MIHIFFDNSMPDHAGISQESGNSMTILPDHTAAFRILFGLLPAFLLTDMPQVFIP